MKQLILAEKPSVARDIARVMGATRKADGKRFTMPIIVELPWIGWFTTEEITPASFAAPALNAVTINYTEHPAQRTLYLLISCFGILGLL